MDPDATGHMWRGGAEVCSSVLPRIGKASSCHTTATAEALGEVHHGGMVPPSPARFLPEEVDEPVPPRGRRLAALAIVIPLLGLSNVMSNRVLPGWAYVPWNMAVAVTL